MDSTVEGAALAPKAFCVDDAAPRLSRDHIVPIAIGNKTSVTATVATFSLWPDANAVSMPGPWHRDIMEALAQATKCSRTVTDTQHLHCAFTNLFSYSRLEMRTSH